MNPSQRVVLILLLVCLLAGIITGTPFYYRLAYFWIILIAVSWLISRSSLRGIIFQRNVRSHRSHVGQIYEERFIIKNKSRIPRLWIEIRDNSNLPGAQGSQVMSMIRGGETRSYLVRTRLSERGVFPLGPTTLASGDLFGLFPVSKDFPLEDSLLVYPMMVDISSFPSPAGWLSGGESLRRRTHQITANAAGVREYVSGDPLNRIHWLSTARRNRLIVKEFELDPMSEIWIFIDAYSKVHSALPREPLEFDEKDIWRPSLKIPIPPSTEEYAVATAASLARYFLRYDRVIGMVSAGHTNVVIPAEKGGRQFGKILESLALLKAEGKLPLQALVEAQLSNLPRGSTIVLITPASGDGVLYSVELVSRRGMRPVVILIDGESFGGRSGSKRSLSQLELLSVPVCRIEKGDDIGSTISHGFSSYYWV